MHFCVPRVGPPPPRQVGGVISLSSPPQLRPPFPLVTMAPQEKLTEVFQSLPVGVNGRRAPLLFHGYLEDKGGFSRLKQHGTDPFNFGEKLLKALEAWEMRPSTQGGSPVRIQVILVVPVG